MDLNIELEYLLKLFISTLLGVLIGFERKLRSKEAGMRTHSLVCLGACLMMIISKDCFSKADQARVAAQIVSGVGFLGAGMIMFKNKSGIHGLTTAAGIWVTAGIGMSIGGGMYILGCSATILMVLVQFIFHIPLKIFKTKKFYHIKVVFESSEENHNKIKELFEAREVTNVKVEKVDNVIVVTEVMVLDKYLCNLHLSNILKDNEFIKFLEVANND